MRRANSHNKGFALRLFLVLKKSRYFDITFPPIFSGPEIENLNNSVKIAVRDFGIGLNEQSLTGLVSFTKVVLG